MSNNRAADILTGLLIGSAIGAVLGILYAPKSGKETREELGKKADELMTKAKEEYECALEKSRKTYETAVKRLKQIEAAAKEKVEDIEEKTAAAVDQGKAAFDENRSRLKRAIDAGVEAYKEEKAS